MGLYSGRLIIGRIFASEIWGGGGGGLIFGRAYFSEGFVIRILGNRESWVFKYGPFNK